MQDAAKPSPSTLSQPLLAQAAVDSAPDDAMGEEPAMAQPVP